MKPMNERDPFRVGLVGLAALLALGLAVVALSVFSPGTSTYTAILAQTAGLRSGESVQVAGVEVGEVRSIELRATDVAVTFTLDSGIDLGSRSTAAVKVATLLGTHYLQVDPVGSGSLADATIPLERTSVPYNLQDVLDQGTDRLEALDGPELAKALTAVSQTLERSDDDVGPALDSVGRLSEVVAARSDQTGELLRAAQQVAELLRDDSTDVYALMKQSSLVFEEITARREAIHRLLVRTTTLADSLSGLVQDTRADLKPALADLDTALAGLREEDDTLQGVLTTMAPAVRYVANATGNGPWLDLFLQSPALLADDQRCRTGDC